MLPEVIRKSTLLSSYVHEHADHHERAHQIRQYPKVSRQVLGEVHGCPPGQNTLFDS